MRAWLALVLAAALAGCGGGAGESQDGVSEQELAELRSSGRVLYWAGRETAGLPLTHAQRTGPGETVFVYGDCDPGGGWFSEGGCAPPIQVQQFPFRGHEWGNAYGCSRLAPIRGLPTARHDGLVLFTGTTVLKVYARSPAEERRVAMALRTLDGGRDLPPPPPRVAEAVDRACGATR